MSQHRCTTIDGTYQNPIVVTPTLLAGLQVPGVSLTYYAMTPAN